MNQIRVFHQIGLNLLHSELWEREDSFKEINELYFLCKNNIKRQVSLYSECAFFIHFSWGSDHSVACKFFKWDVKAKLSISVSWYLSFFFFFFGFLSFKEKNESVGCSVMSDSFETLWTVVCQLLCPWNSPGKNSEVSCHSLLQGIFLLQGSNLGLLHCRQIFFFKPSAPPGKPSVL